MMMSPLVTSLRSRAVSIKTSALRPATHRVACRWLSASSSDSGVQQVEQLLDESVMEHLVCPISKYPLRYDASRGLLICPEIRVAYPIREGVPLLVPSEGRVLREDEEA
ncbi:hypothetical protein PINS_up002335 [Pythium insidiosum]|nr:hypothetical protein PINS_up002335 [Pythium insidiosum]